MHDEEAQEILKKLAIFENMYELIRLVDPVNKNVIGYNNKEIKELDFRCFDLWEKQGMCNNCVSIRAFNENKTFVKLEYTAQKVFMVTAMPYELNGRKIIIELLKNATDSMIFVNGDTDNSTEIHGMIDNMNNMSLKDVVTGIFNRRYINERLPVDLISAKFSNYDISVIMADIDFFKNVNDVYGHLAGDEVLRVFAKTVADGLKRESDWVARFGGEEFLICLPGAGLTKSIEVAERIRREIESKEIVYGDNIIKITVSFGVSSMNQSQSGTADELIELADKMLYRAKHSGRNNVQYMIA